MTETRAVYSTHQAAQVDRLAQLLTADQLCAFVEALERMGEYGEVTIRRAGRRLYLRVTCEAVLGQAKAPVG